MKKLISVLLILSLFSVSVFAAPTSVATVLDKQVPATTQAGSLFADDTVQEQADVDDLFASVEAAQLSNTEAAQVEGGIPPLPIIIICAVILLVVVPALAH